MGSKTKNRKRRTARCEKKGCGVKLGLTGFQCRCKTTRCLHKHDPEVCECKGLFCDRHRYSAEHDCNFDYVAEHKKQLTKDNPHVVASKLDKL